MTNKMLSSENEKSSDNYSKLIKPWGKELK